MTTSPLNMRSTQMQMQDQLVQSQTRDIGNLAKGGKGAQTEAQKEKKLREACEGFESIFIQKMWQQMRATLPKTNMLQGKEEQYWQSMYDQELAKDMTKAGGIGLADMMYDQLSRDLVSASRTAASAVSASSSSQQRGGSNFTTTAAPLLGETQPAQLAAQNAASQALAGTPNTLGSAQDMYSGAALQPEAAENTGQTGHMPAASPQTATASAPASAVNTMTTDNESSPIVQQFLAELRQRQTQQPVQGQTVPPQNAAQGSAVAQHNVQQGPGDPSALTRSQRAQLEAANKPSGHGVMPAMQGQPTQTAQATQMGQAAQNGQAPSRTQYLTPPAASGAALSAASGVPGGASPASYATVPAPLVTQGAQAAFVPPLLNTGSAGNAAIPQATVQQAQAAMHSSAPVTAEATALAAQQAAPVNTAEQQPHVINTTFTTNIPSRNRRSQRPRGQRLPSGQPTIRSLPTPAPASPVTTDAAQHNGLMGQAGQAGQAGTQPVNTAQAAQSTNQGMNQGSPQAPGREG